MIWSARTYYSGYVFLSLMVYPYISMQDHTWECSVELNEEVNYPGSLTGTTTVTVSEDGVAVFR